MNKDDDGYCSKDALDHTARDAAEDLMNLIRLHENDIKGVIILISYETPLSEQAKNGTAYTRLAGGGMDVTEILGLVEYSKIQIVNDANSQHEE